MSARMKASIKFPLITLGVLVAVTAILAMWPYRLAASPNSKLRIVDAMKQPLAGVRVVRSWDTSEEKKGETEASTDARGEVAFERVTFRMSMLRRVSKPLLIFVPSSCGPGWKRRLQRKPHIGDDHVFARSTFHGRGLRAEVPRLPSPATLRAPILAAASDLLRQRDA